MCHLLAKIKHTKQASKQATGWKYYNKDNKDDKDDKDDKQTKAAHSPPV